MLKQQNSFQTLRMPFLFYFRTYPPIFTILPDKTKLYFRKSTFVVIFSKSFFYDTLAHLHVILNAFKAQKTSNKNVPV